MADNLLQLADRCEAATGPSFLLEQEIADAVGHDPRARLPNYTASIDAAMTLVPEGHWWSLGFDSDTWARCYEIGQLYDAPCCDYGDPVAAVTPALALAAAALRALASTQVQETGE